jgi:hypothetical protein
MSKYAVLLEIPGVSTSATKQPIAVFKDVSEVAMYIACELEASRQKDEIHCLMHGTLTGPMHTRSYWYSVIPLNETYRALDNKLQLTSSQLDLARAQPQFATFVQRITYSNRIALLQAQTVADRRNEAPP